MDVIYIIASIVVVLIIIYYVIQNKSCITNDDDINEIICNRLSGEHMDKNVVNVINKIDHKNNKDAYDYYNLGTMYMCHANDQERGYDNYIKSIRAIGDRNVDYDDAVPILYRLEDIINRSNLTNGIYRPRNRNIQHINGRLMNNVRHLQQDIADERCHAASVNKKNKMKDNSNSNYSSTQAKQIESNKKWKTSAQNVHDTGILNTIKSQFDYIKKYNNSKHVPRYTIDQIATQLLDRTNDTRIRDVIHRIRSNPEIIPNLNVKEKDLLIEVYRRIHSPINEKNRNELQDALVTSLLDCVENGNVVCTTGRQSRIMASLAILDGGSNNKGIGILKTKEAIRNEIFEKSAKVVDKYLGENSKTSKQIIDDYNNDNQTPEVKELQNTIAEEIMNLRHDYRGKMDEQKIMDILKECTAAI